MQKDSFREKLQRFDAIRPFTPEELPQVYERLLADQQFRKVVAVVMPELTFEQFAERMRGCRTNLEFQKVFCYGFLEKLLAEASKGCTINTASIDTDKRYTFVSNHRDIVLDSALLDKLLIDAGFGTTCEIAIGDNLLALPWVKDLVRVNKSFIVERSLPPKEMLAASRLLAEYMHFVISEKNDNVWIAQREGRAKDSDDRTQPSILKMMAMGGEGTPLERLRQLHIVPLAISYEYDPCDILKAKEFQCKRDNPAWKKTAQDDIDSMRTGIMGYKGEIHYHCAPCIDSWLDTLSADMPKNDLFEAVARHIDKEIHRNYRLFRSNFIAADLLSGEQRFATHYSPEERAAFLHGYLNPRIDQIQIPQKDENFLRERMLTMYANPLLNHLKAEKE